MATFSERMMGAARLDVAVFEEVEHDEQATGQAAAVVVLASVAAGIGLSDDSGSLGLIGGAIGSLLGWCAWAFTTYVVGTKILPGPKTEADLGQMLRTLGFANSPGVLNVLGIVPGIGALVPVVASLWTLVAMVVAVRQALDYDSTGRAIGVCLLGVLAYVLVLFLAIFTLALLLGRAVD